MIMTRCLIYRSRDGFRWRLVSQNGRIIAESGEAYTRAYDARKAYNTVAQVIVLGVTVVTVKESKK
jgi:uncharacterized protein YegP (UPF0339 family)